MSRKSRKHPAHPKHAVRTASSGPVPRLTLRQSDLALGICLALVLAVGLVFGQSTGFGFLDYDDPEIVSENPIVTKGLTKEGVAWAFTHTQVSSWLPLTSLSHMLDCQIHGLWAGGHHLTNVLIHAATSVLLFLVLRRMTGSMWRSALVAALFALHPLRAESVAWVSERKDLLSGFFFMLVLGSYVRWTRQPGRSRAWPLFFLTLGLLCKAMLITVPLVLLMLDFWPLRRAKHHRLSHLLVEKIPFFILSTAAAAAQVVASHQNALALDIAPFPTRAVNAVVSCAVYVLQLFWPANLAPFYPFPREGVGVLPLLASLAFLAVASAAAYAWRKKTPWLAVGWLWFLVMLVPVLGLIQAGEVARADRYTYLPHIGLYIIIAWAAETWCADRPQRRVAAGIVAGAVVLAMSLMAFRQTGFWKNSEVMWRRALACNPNSDTAHYNLGTRRMKDGKLDDAISHFNQALQANPRFADAHINLGRALLLKGSPDGAIAHYRQALDIKPRFAEAHYNLGVVLAQEKKTDEAITHYRAALEIHPAHFDALNNVGSAYFQAGRLDDAIAHFEEALKIEPDNTKALNNLATAFVQKGRLADALVNYEKVLKKDANHARAQSGLAWILATSPDPAIRNGVRAVELAERALQREGGKNPAMLRTLAAAYAQDGRFELALQFAQRALDEATTQGQTSLVEKLRSDISLYQARQPLR